MNTDETSELHERVIELYKEGKKLAEITRETRVPRATIYWILNKEGIRPDRTSVKAGDAVTVGDVLAELRTTERENGRLQGELAKRDNVITYLLELMQLPEEKLNRVTQFFAQVEGQSAPADFVRKQRTAKAVRRAGGSPARPKQQDGSA